MKTTAETTKNESKHSYNPVNQKREGKDFFPAKNGHEQSFFGPVILQHKLEIGQPNDPYEKEADRVADQVMRMPEPEIQRKCGSCEQEEKIQQKPLVQRSVATGGNKSVSPGISSKIASTRGSGSSLPKATQQEMGSKIGADFSGVKIHTDNTAVQLSQDLGAKAFTVGNDIYFNKGQYNPTSGDGKRLMAHELVHTVQQTTTKGKIQKQGDQRKSCRDIYGSVPATDESLSYEAYQDLQILFSKLDENIDSWRPLLYDALAPAIREKFKTEKEIIWWSKFAINNLAEGLSFIKYGEPLKVMITAITDIVEHEISDSIEASQDLLLEKAQRVLTKYSLQQKTAGQKWLTSVIMSFHLDDRRSCVSNLKAVKKQLNKQYPYISKDIASTTVLKVIERIFEAIKRQRENKKRQKRQRALYNSCMIKYLPELPAGRHSESKRKEANEFCKKSTNFDPMNSSN